MTLILLWDSVQLFVVDTVKWVGFMDQRRFRRQFSADFKRQVVAETYETGTLVSLVARHHDINANLLFRWRDDSRYVFQEHPFYPSRLAQLFEPLSLPMIHPCLQSWEYGLQVMFVLLSKADLIRLLWAA